MARKVTSKAAGPDWFLPEWMGALNVRAAGLVNETGMSKSTISDIVNGRTDYYRALVNEMARALRVEPYELLMHPDEAFALRRLRADALRIAADQPAQWKEKPADLPEWDSARSANNN